MRVTVIGAGVNGCSIGLALRRSGFDVTVVDRLGEVGHGSTSASCGIVRRFYAERGMSALAHEASHIWADWGAFLGSIDEDLAVFHRPGMLFIPPALDDGVRSVVDGLKELGVPAHLLTAAEIRERYPFLTTASHSPVRSPDDENFFTATGREIEGGVFEEDSGYVVSPDLATHNMRLAGEREGVEYRLNHEVTAIRTREDGRFQVEMRGRPTLESDCVVNVSGPHSRQVNDLAGVTLPLETRALRREVHALANPVFDEAAPGCVPVVGDIDSGIYFRPESGGRDLIVGTSDPECDEPEWVEDPDDFHQGITDLYHGRQCMRLMKRFPEVELGPRRGVSALYDVTVADWYPIVDRTDLPGFYVCIGTSGSSFKTAPVLGHFMALLIAAGARGQDTDAQPVQLPLERIGITVDTGFLSRRRGTIHSSGTVIG